MDSLIFLEKIGRAKQPQPLYVLHGDEDFLKRQVLQALRTLALGQDGDEFGMSTHAGDKAEFAAVRDELETIPFLSPRRLVIVENADPFVTRNRPALEKYVTQLPKTGVLVLDVKSWPATARLAKLIDGNVTISCKALPGARLPQWCIQWAATHQGKQLTVPAANLLVELIGADMGQLDQELTKLGIYVGAAEKIDQGDVDKLVGSSRAEDVFKIFNAIAEGRAKEALSILERLFDQGEDPIRILAAFGWQLRRLAQAWRLNQQGQPVPRALEMAGVPPFGIRSGEQQMRHLGRRRLDRLYDWLLETDQGLKGGSPLPPRTLLERLVVRLARKN
jgi:DNA polymerase-3 subunit delta